MESAPPAPMDEAGAALGPPCFPLTRTRPCALAHTHITQQTTLQEFPTLVLKVDAYTHPNGRTSDLLVATGTLPVYYLGVKYNIPVTLWVGEGYPAAAPTLYVTPTAAMVIKPGHSLVDGSGLVATPYLAAWGGR